jgi:hypothetical protein
MTDQQSTEAIDTTGETVGESEEAFESDETAIVEYGDDEDGMAWFDDFDRVVFSDAREREAKRGELLKRGNAFKLVEHDVTQTLGAFWDFMTR